MVGQCPKPRRDSECHDSEWTAGHVHESVLGHELEPAILITSTTPQPVVPVDVIGWFIRMSQQDKGVIRCDDTIYHNGTIGCQWCKDSVANVIVLKLDNFERLPGSTKEHVTLFKSTGKTGNSWCLLR